MATVWLLQDGEPLPIDEAPRLLRSGNLASHLVEKGHEVFWFSSVINHAQHQRRPQGRGIVEVNDSGSYRIVLLQGLSYQGNLSPQRVISQALGGADFFLQSRKLPSPDIIVSAYPSPELAFFGAHSAKHKKVPFVIDVRDMWPDSFRGYLSGWRRILLPPIILLYGILFRYALSNSKLVIASARAFMDGTKNHYFSPSVLHEVLYLGYPDSHHKDWLPSCRPTAKLEVVFVSSFGLSYDGLRLIEIAKQICPEKQDSIQFTFIGDGEHRKEWELAAEGCSCVRFLGWCNAKRLHETLNNSHVGVIFMHSHAHIPVPNKFFEYLCYGLVVLSSVPGEMAEIVEQQQIGLTLTDRSKDGDAVRYLEALIDNREHLADIRIKSRRLFADHYCSPAINHRYMQLIEEVLRVTPQE